jgi:predicted chitinase
MSSYFHQGPYDRAAFQRGMAENLGRDPRYSAEAMPQALTLLGLIEADTGIADVRHAAYMLATVYWETTSPTVIQRAALNKQGKPLKDKQGRPVIVRERVWRMTMAPVSEVGAGRGRRYHEPVKIKSLPDGGVRITEQDGDQFHVGAGGRIRALTKNGRMGSPSGGAVHAVYDADDGSEQAYFGRGYVQLTWWSNYAAAGVALGRGLDLLLDPEKVKQAAVAYALMSHGMRTGFGFANGHRFSQYFTSAQSDYVGARRMVNGTDHAQDIAAIAQRFETVLMASRTQCAQPAMVAP